MKNNTKKGILVLVLLLAIGFAATTTNLIINGNSSLAFNSSDYDIYFSSATPETGGTATIDETTKKTITYSTKKLQNIGDEAILDYVVTNNSAQYDATGTVSVELENGASEYVTVQMTGIDDSTPVSLPAKSSISGRLKVSLKKRSLDDIDFDIIITLNFSPVGRNTIAEDDTSNYLRNMILRDNQVIEPTATVPNFTSTSHEAEDPDGLYVFTVNNQGYGGTNNGGTTYYFRGDVENNRVYFAGFHWNIVRINEDGTIRLLAESLIQGSDGILQFDNSYTSINNMYYSNNTNAKSEIDTWYHTYIEEPGYDSYVASGNYFCEQAKVTWNDGSYGTGNASMTYYDSYSPTLECSTDGNGYGLYNGKVALITYDELLLAGAYPGQNNTYYYIHKNANVYSWWTMSPMGMAGNAYASAWRIDAYGELEDNATTERLGLVPVINLKANVTATKDPDSGEYIIDYQEGD